MPYFTWRLITLFSYLRPIFPILQYYEKQRDFRYANFIIIIFSYVFVFIRDRAATEFFPVIRRSVTT